MGCRYGRDFMPGHQLSYPIVRALLDDAKKLGFWSVRFYGGEPLLHPDLCRMVEHASQIGLRPLVTTNAALLERKVDELYEAGLRHIDIGFYGTGEDCNEYVQRQDHYARMEAGIAYARERYGMSIRLGLGWLLMRPTCNLKTVRDMWQFSERYSIPITVNLIHYSVPYFTEGPYGELQFRAKDRSAIELIVAELIRLKHARPELLGSSIMGLRSIPDWLLKKREMKIPCDRYRMIWVGPDGSVQLCFVTFKLGNLHEKRLAEMLFTRRHQRVVRDCFFLKCPNCHCGYDSRIQKHAPSRRFYSA
jgi:MoaA/NifB/PqqE/SkfB family radical SAM enzyme